jgi:hypothetical protein
MKHRFAYKLYTTNKNKRLAHNTTKIEKSLYFQTVKFDDNLPLIIKNLKNDILFKKMFKKLRIIYFT